MELNLPVQKTPKVVPPVFASRNQATTAHPSEVQPEEEPVFEEKTFTRKLDDNDDDVGAVTFKKRKFGSKQVRRRMSDD